MKTMSVFHALGLENADDLLRGAEALSKIGKIIEVNELTISKIAKKTGMSEERAGALVEGRLSKFSTQELIDAVAALEMPVVRLY